MRRAVSGVSVPLVHTRGPVTFGWPVRGLSFVLSAAGQRLPLKHVSPGKSSARMMILKMERGQESRKNGRIPIRMQNAEAPPGQQIDWFPGRSEGIVFNGESRKEIYAWNERLLPVQERGIRTRSRRLIHIYRSGITLPGKWTRPTLANFSTRDSTESTTPVACGLVRARCQGASLPAPILSYPDSSPP